MVRITICILVLIPFLAYTQLELKNCENNKELCLESYLLKWRGTYSREFNVVKHTFPDEFDKRFDNELLDSIYSYYDLKGDSLRRDNFKRIYSRYDYYDLEKHFNKNQKITFLDTLEIKKSKKVFRFIESFYYQDNYMIVQYSLVNQRILEVLKFDKSLNGYEIIASVIKEKIYNYDGSFYYKYHYRKTDYKK
ncbi:hypothetical protein [Nonlabens ulvanivorans]|uniref:Uncharacterized protein n=1 Tax=Nonlabens ulvanivorans TaxID=906888 RepID=A0ABX5EAZ7_NONUL|nr:hypothetical protein [Nonlabens ulvanivorans]PRX15235.1 hypothetical protein LY02_00450 [Nonlabens ulvanivorans]